MRKIYATAREQKNAARNRRRQRMVAYSAGIKSQPCMDCGGEFPAICMDFDHRPGTVKAFDVSQTSRIPSWQALKDEIAKCDVVCANCHRIRTKSRIESGY